MTFRILSLSGGGVRGIFQAAYLKEISTRLGGPIRNHFDLIAGTSTGGIIALGVALNVDVNRIVDLFSLESVKIFPPHVYRRSQKLRSWFGRGPRYDSEPLRVALSDTFRGSSGHLQLAHCAPPVLIPAVALERYRGKVFSSRVDGSLFAADVALATAAAPLFFPSVQPSGRTATGDSRPEQRSYVDGGLWANNPSLLAVLEAKRLFDVSYGDIRLVSLGNGEVPSGDTSIDFNRMWRAKMLKSVFDMMLATQSELSDRSAAQLLQDQDMTGRNMLRINVQLEKFIDLDDAEEAVKRLKPLAEQVASDTFHQFASIVSP